MANPACEIKNGAAAYVPALGGVNITPGATVVIRLMSQAGVGPWSCTLATADELTNIAAINASLVIDSVAKTATFTAPAAGAALRFQSRVNQGVNTNGVADDSLTTTFCLYTLAGSGARVHALDETTEGNGLAGWGADINALLRSGGGGGGTASANVFTPEQAPYNAVGDGSTSDQAAFVAVLAAMSARSIITGTGCTLLLGAAIYLLTGGLAVPAGCAIVGQGSDSVLKTNTDASLLTLDGAEDVDLLNFRIEGNVAGSNQFGVACGSLTAGQARVRIHGLTLHTLYRGLSFQRNNGGADGPQVSDCRARACSYAFYCDTGSEWVTFTNCHAYQGSRGLYVGSGNISWTGGTLNYNTYGVYLAAGANDSHGIVSGAHIDHNVTSVYSDATANGFVFEACNLYEGTIELVGNTGLIDFADCTIDPDHFIFTNSRARFSNCRIDSAYFIDYTDTGTADTEWINCRHINGTIPSYVGSRQRQVFTFGADADVTLSRQVSRAPVLDVQAGVISAERAITSARAPNVGESVTLCNRTAYTLDFLWASGVGIKIPTLKTAIIDANGSDAVCRLITDNVAASTGGGPVVSAISPALGDTDGGGGRVVATVSTSVGATGMTLGGVAVTSFAIDDATHVSGIPGIHPTPGAVNVVVTNGSGTGTLTNGFEYWTPAQVTGVDQYLDSNKGVVGGAAVSSWTDQSANAVVNDQATAANKPAQTAAVFGTLPSIRFVNAGGPDFLNVAGGVNRTFAAGWSVFFVAQWTAATSVGARGEAPMNVVGNNHSGVGANAGTLAYADWSANTETDRGSSLNDGVARLLGWTHDSATGDLKAYSGTTQQGTTATVAYNAGDGYLYIGCSNSVALGWDGDLGAIVVVSGVISGGDLAKLNTWAKQRFGTP